MTYVPEYYLLNSYPLTIVQNDTGQSGDVLFAEVKVIITESKMFVYEQDRSLVFEANVTDYAGNVVTGYNIKTDKGIFHMFKSGGCGCGSTLKSYNPFGFGIPYDIQLRK